MQLVPGWEKERQKAEFIELLKQIAEVEDGLDPESFKGMAGWRSRDVGIWAGTLTKLRMEGLIEDAYESNSYHGYRLTQKARGILETGEPTRAETSQNQKLEVPDDLFEVIEGYEDIKALVRQVLGSEKPVHILFSGVPSSAKTMFLLELSRMGAPYILGSQSTKAGIADLLFDTEPEILLVDEIDRIGTKDIAVLLSLTQTGIVSETKSGKRREIKLATKVFAASNTLKMAQELLSRFMVLRFQPYKREDFLLVASNLLRKRENVDGDLASYIAEKVWSLQERFPDPRQAVRIARLAKTREEVDRLLGIIMRYSG
jgi:Holliday junction DNA helicase RuvB